MQDSWLVVLPPLVAVVLAIWSRQVLLSLFVGLWVGCALLEANVFSGLTKTFYNLVAVFKDNDNTRVIIFCLMVGALITMVQRSGGVSGFVEWISRRGIVQTRKGAGICAYITGFVIFVESSITCLVVGSVFRPIFDRLRISREKLAYICDSTSAPVCILIPFNGWGAYIMGLLAAQQIGNPLVVLFKSLLFNWYAILTLAMVLWIVLREKDFGPMAVAEKRAREEGKVLRDGAKPLIGEDIVTIDVKPNVVPQARNMLIPLAIMVVMVPIGLFLTGYIATEGKPTSFMHLIDKASGSTAVFFAVLTAIISAQLFYKWQGIFSFRESTALTVKGMVGLIQLGLLMMMAFALGSICKELKTGIYVANVVKSFFRPELVPMMLFVVSCFIAFSTGTSWGTFGIMMAIGIPLVDPMNLNLYLVIGAILGGGIFGDHCSPISDTTIISSMASASDHIDHVRTQLPYALVVGGITAVLYTIAGFLF